MTTPKMLPMLKRIGFPAFFGLVASCALSEPSKEPLATAPNVILIMADDLGWGDVGYQGHPLNPTPNLDAMSANGLTFERFYAAAPVCSPTRGSCLTGRHPFRYGIRGANSGHLPVDEPNLAELLRAKGYATGHFGKWHLGTLTKTVIESNRGGPRGVEHYAPPWERGFDVCFSTEAKVPTFDPMEHPDTGEPYGTFYWNERGERVDDNLKGDDSRIIMDRAVPFIRKAVENERAFLCVVWFHAPHLPVKASAEDRAPFSSLSERLQHFYGCIRVLDREVGRLRALLRELEIADETIVWFASDNGPEGSGARELGSTGGLRGRKRSLYEGGVRVPGIVEWPGRIAPASRTEVPAVTSDYLPTLCELIGLPRPEREFDGISLVPWLEGSRSPRGSPIGFQSRKQRSWISDRYKLYGLEKDGVTQWELYDLQEDPGETRDLAATHPQLDEMVADYRAWQATTAAR